MGYQSNSKNEILALNDARDWSHLFSEESASRKSSVMQAMHGILAQPGIRSLGPGAPSTEYIPFYGIDFKVGSTDAFETVGKKTPSTTTSIQAGKHDSITGASKYDLAIALQYGLGTGSKQLVEFLTEHIQLIHSPPYRDWQTILSAGNTSAFEIVLRMLGNKGEYLLVEQHTYTTVFETGLPLGFKFAQVRMDKDGLLPEDLDHVLSNRDEAARGGEKPRLLYTIPGICAKSHWGHLGFVRWLVHLRGEYAKRRDTLLEACDAFLSREIVSWVPPTAGFFNLISLDWAQHPEAGTKTKLQIEKEIFDATIENGALVVPGSWFLPDEGSSGMDGVFFRMTYAAASMDDMQEAIQRLGAVLRSTFMLGHANGMSESRL